MMLGQDVDERGIVGAKRPKTTTARPALERMLYLAVDRKPR